MSYNVLRQFVGTGWVGGGVGADIRGRGGGGVGQNRESPDFRSPEVGRYVSVMFLLVSKFKMIGMLLNVVQVQKS